MGKTALATNIAFSVAKAGTPVGFFSQEMTAPELGSRIISDHTGLNSHKMRKGEISQDDARVLQQAKSSLGKLPIVVDESGGHTLGSLVNKARRWKKRKNIGFLVIDYIQLMRGPAKGGNSNRAQDIADITNGLKSLAKELGVPILALAQLNRATEQREEKRPQLSDIRESGSIEQDADAVWFAYREEYYLTRREPPVGDVEKHRQWQAELESCRGIAEIVIGKQRHGPIGIVRTQFDAERTKFSDLSRVR